MTTKNSRAADEARIREIIEGRRVRAVRAKDVHPPMSHTPNVVMFDALDPLRYAGADAVRERAGQWLSWYQGPQCQQNRNSNSETRRLK